MDRQLRVQELGTNSFLDAHSLPPVPEPVPEYIPSEPCAKEVWLTKCYPLVGYRSQLQPEAMQGLYRHHATLASTLKQIRAKSLADTALLERDFKDLKDETARRVLSMEATFESKRLRLSSTKRGPGGKTVACNAVISAR